jgi:hypothetical protein
MSEEDAKNGDGKSPREKEPYKPEPLSVQ